MFFFGVGDMDTVQSFSNAKDFCRSRGLQLFSPKHNRDLDSLNFNKNRTYWLNFVRKSIPGNKKGKAEM